MKTFIMILILASLSAGLSAQFGGGSGTAADPYLVFCPDHLALISSYKSSHFRQIIDIDLNQIPYNQGEGWVPIATQEDEFTGSYDGDGFKISNLFIDRDHYQQSLFGVAENATIENLTLENVSLDAGSDTSGLLGQGYNCLVRNCHVSGYIDGEDCTGGIIGDCYYGNIQDCTVDLELRGHEAVAGIVGFAYATHISNCDSHISQSYSLYGLAGIAGYCIEGSTVRDCSFWGNLHCGGGYTGGIVGEAKYTTIENCQVLSGYLLAGGTAGGIIGHAWVVIDVINCHANLDIRGLHTAGGVVGMAENYTFIESCSSTGDIEGFYYIGGLVGHMIYSSAQNCYARGNVDGNDHVGGFTGGMGSGEIFINNCYCTGVVTATDAATTGGFAGIGYPGAVLNSYWDTQSSGCPSSPVGEGRTTAQMTLPYADNTYLGWDFATIWDHDSDGVNSGYPILRPAQVGVDDDLELPAISSALIAGPNPFKDQLRIKVEGVKSHGNAVLSIYNLRGRRVRSLKLSLGCTELLWDGRDDAGQRCSSGVYLLRLKVDGRQAGTRKITLVK